MDTDVEQEGTEGTEGRGEEFVGGDLGFEGGSGAGRRSWIQMLNRRERRERRGEERNFLGGTWDLKGFRGGPAFVGFDVEREETEGTEARVQKTRVEHLARL